MLWSIPLYNTGGWLSDDCKVGVGKPDGLPFQNIIYRISNIYAIDL